MAWYPSATKRPLPQNATQPSLDPISIVLHTAVSRSNSLYDFFNGRSQGVESHFYVTSDGVVEQYISTTVRADCQRDGNRFAISIETEDNGASNPNDIIPWSAKQLDAIVRLCVWLCKTHGIPARKCPAYNGSGLGYHALFTGNPGWNTSHACPARERIRQFPTLLSRVASGVAGAATPPKEDDELTPAQAKQLADTLEAVQAVNARLNACYESLLDATQTWGARSQAAGREASGNVEESEARLQTAAKFTDDKVDEALVILKAIKTAVAPTQPLPLPKGN